MYCRVRQRGKTFNFLSIYKLIYCSDTGNVFKNNTYVGCRYFDLRICDRFGQSEICRSMLIEVAHLARSMLFLQTEPENNKKKKMNEIKIEINKVLLTK